MSRNNVKLLTDVQFNKLNEKYIFEIEDDMILVKLKNYGRVTKHAIDKPFHINCKSIRKVCFSMDAINIWRSLYNKGLPSLLSVQHAVNQLTVTYQKINEENVKKLLRGTDIKIKKI